MSKGKDGNVKFVEFVPKRGRGKFEWPQIISELRAAPGQWAVVEGDEPDRSPNSASATSRNLREGHVKGTYPGEFETATRGNVIYARYVGKQDD